MKRNRQSETTGLLLGAVLLVTATSAWADVGLPAVIKMPGDTPQATSGEEYAGVFEIHIVEAGELTQFTLVGDGWRIRSFDVPGDPAWTEPGLLLIPFRAVPRDANRPIRLSFAYDGHRVSKAYEVGPKYFGRVGKTRALQSVGVRLEETLSVPLPQDASEAQMSPSGGAIPLRFTGRFVYTRSDGRVVGADNIWVEVMDDDGLAGDALVDESIWSGRTDVNGYFDSGVISWDDCDVVGCDEPDIYVRFECDTAVGQVQESGILEEDYFWWTMDRIHEDFTGSEIHFGTMWPTDAAEMPAVHIWNSLVRTHRYIKRITLIDVDHVDIQWPESVNGAWYDAFFDEIHIGPDRQWNEGTHTHEYGHHFMEMYSVNTTPDYCNGFCDGENCSMCSGSGCPGAGSNDCPDPGHCMWCPETDHDAWNEGWPNWLADVVTRSYQQDYEFDDCTPYTALIPRSLDDLNTCCQDGQFQDPFITEGFPGALLRDIEDEKDDAHDPNDDDVDWGGDQTDCLALGPAEIFTVVTQDQPTTPAQFLNMFRVRYPQHTPGLWKTAQNIHPSYVAGFPADTTPPGPVIVLDSPTHPSGVGGALPCITVEFDQPADDVTGSKGFSVDFTTNSGGTVPIESINWPGSCVSQATSPPRNFGDYYVSIRAVDWENQWGPPATFGPFTVNGDCNANGIIDVCDIACDASTYAQDAGLQCTIPASFCNVPGCGTTQDCNLNLIPDDCDLASGTSKDCDQNGMPDECDGAAGRLIQWADGNGSWHNPNNWYKLSECPPEPPPPTCDSTFPASCPAVPEVADNVCINSAFSNITVSYTDGVTDINTLACYESLDISGGSPATMKLLAPSWIDGSLGLGGNNSVLEVNDRLDIGGLFTWTGSNVTSSAKLKGAGVTYAKGGVDISEVVHLEGHHLILDGNSTSVSTTGRVDFISPSVVEIRPGSTYEHQGSGYILRGWFDDMFVNGGTLIKSVDPGTSLIYMFTNNSGLIHVQTGTLKFFLGGSSTGDLLGDLGTTLEFYNGGHDFLPSSSIVADNVMFTIGGGNTIRGTYDITTATTITGSVVTFTSEANILSYGPSFYIPRGIVNFDAIIGGTIPFDTLSIGPGLSGAGTANFNSGDPVQITNLILGPGTIKGPSPITLTGLTTWNASGHFSGPGTVNVNGDILINLGGGEKTIRDCIFNNAATATLLGWFSMSSSAVFNNLATGVLDIQVDGGVIQALQQTINNTGTIVKSAGTGTTTISGRVTNTGIVEIKTGELEFYTYFSGYYIQTAGQTVLNGGDLAMFGPAPVQIDGGSLTGSGLISANVVNTGGSVEPGLSVGQLTVHGTYMQGSAGSYGVELGGSLSGEYDTLDCTGNASLSGDLEVVLVSSFEPNAGDRFQILLGSSVTGVFEQVSVPNLVPPMEVITYYSPTTVTLIVAPVAGDCDDNYVVGLGDLAELAPCMAGPQGGLGQDCDCADIDGDGDVDLGDAALYQSTFTGPLP